MNAINESDFSESDHSVMVAVDRMKEFELNSVSRSRSCSPSQRPRSISISTYMQRARSLTPHEKPADKKISCQDVSMSISIDADEFMLMVLEHRSEHILRDLEYLDEKRKLRYGKRPRSICGRLNRFKRSLRGKSF